MPDGFAWPTRKSKSVGIQHSTPKTSTYLSCTCSCMVLICLSMVHGFCIRRGSVLSFSCYTQCIYFKYILEMAFFRKKTFAVFEVRRWLNRSTSLSWTPDSHFSLPSTAQTLGSENGRENWIIGQKNAGSIP